MHQENAVKTIIVLSLLCALCMSIGCATGKNAMTPEQQEASLKLAAGQYWNDRIEGKYETAYAVEDKKGVPSDFTEYKLKASQLLKMNPQKVSIAKITIDDQRGVVTVIFDIRIPSIAKPFTKYIQDEWVFREGKWLHRFGD